VERPYVERHIMPTTWQDIGVGVVGRTESGAIAYRAYVLTGLDAHGFTALNSVRGGLSHGSEGAAEDLAGVARVEYATGAGLALGASGYYGGADQGDSTMGDVTVAIVSADARFRKGGLDLRGVLYRTSIDGADAVSLVNGETVGEAALGWYAEAAFDVLRRGAAEGESKSLVIFGRIEDFDTQDEIPAGPLFVRDPAAGRQVLTGGVAFYPIDKVAFKGDLEHWEDDSGAEVDRLNLGLAFRF
jgi:hypothetical protein